MREGIPTQAMRSHMRSDAQSYAERNGSGGAGMRQSAANAPVHGWAVPTPTLSAPSRKTPECEVDDPEGNLVIVERVVHENQRHFPDWEHGWVGSAHVLNSTAYGTHTSHARHFPRLDKHCIRRVDASRFAAEVITPHSLP